MISLCIFIVTSISTFVSFSFRSYSYYVTNVSTGVVKEGRDIRMKGTVNWTTRWGSLSLSLHSRGRKDPIGNSEWNWLSYTVFIETHWRFRSRGERREPWNSRNVFILDRLNSYSPLLLSLRLLVELSTVVQFWSVGVSSRVCWYRRTD